MLFLKYALAAFSIGSAIAAPALERSFPVTPADPVTSNPVDTVIGIANVKVLVSTVATVKASVQTQLTAIQGLVGVQVTAEVAPQVQASLVLIRKEILSIETNLEPLLAGVIQPLLQDELDVVLNLLNDVITLVNGVEATVKNLLTTLPAELQKTLQSELTAVLAILNPILTPVVSLVTGLVGSNTGVVVDQINGLVGTLNGLLGGLLNPLLGTLGAIL